MPNGAVVAHVISVVDRASIISCLISPTVQFLPSATRLALAAGDEQTRGVILELHGEGESDLALVALAMARRHTPIPLLLRFALPAGTRPLVRNADCGIGEICLSLRGYDLLEESVRRFVDGPDADSANGGLLARLIPIVNESVRDISIAAIAVSARSSSVRDLANACNSSVRRIEERLADAGGLGAKRLLMKLQVLHIQWRMTRLGWSAKRAAIEVGCESADTLIRRVERSSGFSVSRLMRERTFADCLDALASECTGR
jgi:hypothetical protein